MDHDRVRVVARLWKKRRRKEGGLWLVVSTFWQERRSCEAGAQPQMQPQLQPQKVIDACERHWKASRQHKRALLPASKLDRSPETASDHGYDLMTDTIRNEAHNLDTKHHGRGREPAGQGS
jgi:hypothetical protein